MQDTALKPSSMDRPTSVWVGSIPLAARVSGRYAGSMGDIINLRQACKARKRAEAAQQAEANRLKHDLALDGARREVPED